MSAVDILVVEDDREERERIARALAPWRDALRVVGSVAAARAAIGEREPSLVVLDLGLPDADGIKILAQLRQVSDAPVLVYSGRATELDIVTLLEAGADDYVIKPASENELRARVRTQLRRVQADRLGGPGVIRAGDLSIDVARKRVVRGDAEIRLTPTEWALLRELVANAGTTVTVSQLWARVWDREFGDAGLHVRVQVTHLRRKIEEVAANPRLILTDPGVGYRFELP
jgi:two-component system KDP operon response regulator KdpE